MSNEIIDKQNRWHCACGHWPLEEFDQCDSCYKLKPGAPGWVCPNCLFKNDELLTICKVCDQIRDTNIKIGIDYSKLMQNITIKKIIKKDSFTEAAKFKKWTCTCGESNSNDFEVCQRCYKIKPSVIGWVCQICKGKNEYFINICSLCNRRKGDIPEEMRNPLKPEKTSAINTKTKNTPSALGWVCHICKGKNEYFSNICSLCNSTQRDIPEEIQIPLKKETTFKLDTKIKDEFSVTGWVCQICKGQNGYFINFCSFCNRRKGDSLEELRSPSKSEKVLSFNAEAGEKSKMPYKNTYFSPQEKTQEVLETGQWRCKKCKDINEDWRIHCRTCRYYKDYNLEETRNEDLSFGKKQENNKSERNCIKCARPLKHIKCPVCKKIETSSIQTCGSCNSNLSHIDICCWCYDSIRIDSPKSSEVLLRYQASHKIS